MEEAAKGIMREDESLDAKIGKRIRKVRRERGLSQSELAAASGLSSSALGLIERGQTSPNLSTLLKLAATLEIEINEFFNPLQSEVRISFRRTNQRLYLPVEQGYLSNLNTGVSGSQIKPFILKLEPGAESGKNADHGGREFVFCLSGKILYIIDKQAFLMEPGDSLLFDSSLLHSWRNPTDQPTEVLLILSQSEGEEGQHCLLIENEAATLGITPDDAE